MHGGKRYREPRRITTSLLDYLRKLVPADPDHMPQSLAAIEEITRAYPALSQVACLDTAFRGRMPRVARPYALPRRLAEAGVVRYGFHGLSCEYVMKELRAVDRTEARGRVIIAHLGNGASMTAVRDGVGVDTTMGYTPTGGVMMGTRSGDLDPGVLLHMLLSEGMEPAVVGQIVNREAGLRGRLWLATRGSCSDPDLRVRGGDRKGHRLLEGALRGSARDTRLDVDRVNPPPQTLTMSSHTRVPHGTLTRVAPPAGA